MSIGVVTSETGAAFQDIRSTLERRWPMAVVKLYHASVQGAGAAPEIVAGIERFSRRGDVDVLIVGRGGGSLEDLWPFNEEAVARAIAACPIPVISAVGHETDFSISDFVADARAATPTQSVVLATPDVRDLRLGVDDRAKALDRSVRERMRQKRELVGRLSASHGLLALRDKLQLQRARFDRAPERMRMMLEAVYAKRRKQIEDLEITAFTRMSNRLQSAKDKHLAVHHQLETLNPETPLAMGYVRVMQDGAWIRTVAKYQPGTPTELVWKDGKAGIGNQ
jgi:exodeoxyribonuclease VII large subunit